LKIAAFLNSFLNRIFHSARVDVKLTR